MKALRGSRAAKSSQAVSAANTTHARRPDLLRRQDLPPMPSQNRSRAKREALLRAAVELFGRNGYEATGIGDIAARAETAVGGFYQHFRSKRQLLLVLMNELLAKLEQIDMRPATGDLMSAIESVLRAGLATDLTFAGAYRAWREAILSDRGLAALDSRVRAWTTGRLRAVFALLQNLPNSRPGVDVSLFAAVMDRLFWDLLGSSLESEARLVETLTHVIYHSLLEDPRLGAALF
jgi:AcrR family transcriptional regulator